MKKLLLTGMVLLSAALTHAKTLIVYYSFTNNTHTICTDLQKQTGALLPRIEPAEEGIDYAANGFAAGSALIQAIRNNPDDATSYPSIKPVTVNLSEYDTVIIGAPLWWSNMAAPLQTFLFHHGSQMAGKHIGLIVSSSSTGINGVEQDARRLIPGGLFLSPSLWIRSAQTSNCHPLSAAWLETIGYGNLASAVTAVEGNTGVEFTVSEGKVRVEGAFDRLSLYNSNGTKVWETGGKQSKEKTGLAPGVYVGYVVKGRQSTMHKIYVAD